MSSPTTSPFSSTVTCTSAKDLVAATPFLLGYTVTNSIVVLLMSEKVSRGAFRIALPNTQENSSTRVDFNEIAHTISDIVRELRDITQVAMLYYTDEEITDPAALPGHALIDICRREVARIGRETLETVCVSRTSWASFDAEESTRWGGNRLDDVVHSAVALECTARISQPIRDLAQAAELPQVSEQTALSVARSCARTSPWPREYISSHAAVEATRDLIPLWQKSTGGSGEKMRHTEHAKLISALQKEEHWLTAAFTGALTVEGSVELIETSFDLHGVTMREFLMRPPGGRLFSASSRQRVITRVLSELGNERPQLTHLRQFTDYLAILSAYSPPRLRTNIDALRAFTWWLMGMATVTLEILRRHDEHPHKKNHACMMHSVKDLVSQASHPAWIIADHNSDVDKAA